MPYLHYLGCAGSARREIDIRNGVAGNSYCGICNAHGQFTPIYLQDTAARNSLGEVWRSSCEHEIAMSILEHAKKRLIWPRSIKRKIDAAALDDRKQRNYQLDGALHADAHGVCRDDSHTPESLS